jgi:hypothetical protein
MLRAEGMEEQIGYFGRHTVGRSGDPRVRPVRIMWSAVLDRNRYFQNLDLESQQGRQDVANPG